jgi:transcriptional regulator NrdR family protein
MAKMYCPNCKGITEVKVTGMSKQPLRENRVYYKRVKTCQSCSVNFTTVEVEEKLINEYDKMKELIYAIYDATKSFVPLKKKLSLKKRA